MSFAELWQEDEVGRFFLLRYVQVRPRGARARWAKAWERALRHVRGP